VSLWGDDLAVSNVVIPAKRSDEPGPGTPGLLFSARTYEASWVPASAGMTFDYAVQAFFFIMKAWKAAMVSGAVRRLAKILISSSTRSDRTDVSPRISFLESAIA